MSTGRPTEIFIVEDHDEIRNGMAFIINTDPGFHCMTCKSAEEALKKMNSLKPDVVLMDINLPGMNGIECTRYIKEIHPDVLVLMCTVFDDSERIFDALKSGANGYILKKTAGESLIDAIRELLKGGAPMSIDIARKVVDSFRESSLYKCRYPELTDKENEILDLLSKGYGNKEIAGRLFVSVNTVRTHIYHIYEKLHVHNRVEALNKIKKTTLQG